MRLFSKVFFSITTILCLALAVSGCFLMSASFTDALERETERTIDAWRMTRYVLQTTLGRSVVTREPDHAMFAQVVPDMQHSGLVSVFDENDELVFTEYEGEVTPAVPESGSISAAQGVLANNREAYVLCGVQTLDGRSYLTVSGTFHLSDRRMRLALSEDITEVFRSTNRQLLDYRLIYACVCTVSLFAVVFFTIRLVGPIGRTARSAVRIAEGDYKTRVEATGDDELGDLAKSFNAMAQAVDKSVDALNKSVSEKEDFVANFAHELKTPLTSVIGYADMLVQKDVTGEQVRSYAQYILEEGLRLEALSYKLMELIVLNRQDFVLEALSAREVFENIKEGVLPLTREKQVKTEWDTADAYIRVEYDLFKTMLLNLVDNAVKAQARTIRVRGFTAEEEAHYVIEVTDDGCGMPKEALSRITEAFYMVDKSRSRAQHGAGLGLALVRRITQLHDAALAFESEPGKGTTVRITMPLRQEDLVVADEDAEG